MIGNKDAPAVRRPHCCRSRPEIRQRPRTTVVRKTQEDRADAIWRLVSGDAFSSLTPLYSWPLYSNTEKITVHEPTLSRLPGPDPLLEENAQIFSPLLRTDTNALELYPPLIPAHRGQAAAARRANILDSPPSVRLKPALDLAPCRHPARMHNYVVKHHPRCRHHTIAHDLGFVGE